MNTMKKLIIICVVIIFIVIIILGIITLSKENNNFNNKEEIIEAPENNEYSGIFENIVDKNDYFAIKNIINKYLSCIQNINGDVYINMDIQERTKEEVINRIRQEAVEKVKDMLDTSYIEEFNITSNTIIKESEKYAKSGNYEENNVDYNLDIDSIYVAKMSEDYSIYLVSYKINNIQLQMIIKVDFNNSTYSLYLQDYINKYDYSHIMNKDDIKMSNNKIIENDNNIFNYVITNNETMAKEYFSIYKERLLNYVEDAYNSLDDSYKHKRFGSLDEFKKYVEQNYEKLSNITLAKYKVDNIDNYIQYICIDTEGKYYIFRESSVMNYTVVLDTYTIDLPEFIEEYESANEMKKVALNIQKVFEAFNNQDYKYVYNVLADSFKNNNYKTYNEFEQYIRNNLFTNNTVEYLEFSTESGVYIYSLKVLNTENDSEYRKITIIMQLNEGTDFKMSFNIE